jgi:hypothetical protein
MATVSIITLYAGLVFDRPHARTAGNAAALLGATARTRRAERRLAIQAEAGAWPTIAG